MKEFVEKLISRLEDLKVRNSEIEGIDSQNRSKAYENAISIVNELAEEYSVDAPQKSANDWISCDERLPEDWENVYIAGEIANQSSYKDVFGECVSISENCYYGYFHNGKFFGYTEDGVFWEVDAKAWQPLPEPYKEVGAK